MELSYEVRAHGLPGYWRWLNMRTLTTKMKRADEGLRIQRRLYPQRTFGKKGSIMAVANGMRSCAIPLEQSGVYGYLTVIRRSPVCLKNVWQFRCKCGRIVNFDGARVRHGIHKSCGCMVGNPTHGHSKNGTRSSENHTWRSLRGRCLNKRHRQYRYYGGRGIGVCERWDSFENFYADMGPKPSPDHSIDRIDNDGDYCPENCRWATKKQQSENRRCAVLLTANGETLHLSEWAKRLGVSKSTISDRLSRGWSVSRAVTEPVKQ